MGQVILVSVVSARFAAHRAQTTFETSHALQQKLFGLHLLDALLSWPSFVCARAHQQHFAHIVEQVERMSDEADGRVGRRGGLWWLFATLVFDGGSVFVVIVVMTHGSLSLFFQRVDAHKFGEYLTPRLHEITNVFGILAELSVQQLEGIEGDARRSVSRRCR